MDWLAQIVGVVLIIIALIDIYLTVLYPRLGSSLLSLRISRGVWCFFRWIARAIPQKSDRILSHSGSIIIIVIVVVWVTLLIFGFALIFWPELGVGLQATRGQTSTDFATALYYSGFSFTTLGTGDIIPKTGTYRLLMLIEAALGFSVFTLTITYLLSVYSAIIKRNSFALSLHHLTADTAEAAEFLVRLGVSDKLNDAQQYISVMAEELISLLELQHSYPVLLYFRFRQTYYALPRIILIVMDTATLIKSALNTEKYRSLVRSAALTQLSNGGLHLLNELTMILLPKKGLKIDGRTVEAWRQEYYRAVEILKAEGIETVTDLDAGANLYISLCREWTPCLIVLADYMGYKWSEIQK